MSNLVILPIILPMITALIVALFRKGLPAVRTISIIMTIVNLIVTSYITYLVFHTGTLVLETGGWKAPYGIVLVADKLSILLVLTTNVIALTILLYAIFSLGEEKEKYYFYTFTLLLIASVSGAFLTGDLFNLFVFYEVLLMASYALMILGGKKGQIRESFKYLLMNLFSSMLFVIAVAFLYSVTGTVNMAQLAERVGSVNQSGILTAIAILLFIVFATKSALFPLYYWMPSSYSKPPIVISALFGALLTKVGVYSILRVFSLIFIGELSFTHEMFIILSALTMFFGVIGALSTTDIRLIVIYNIIPAIGYMLMGIGIFGETALAGSIYYLIQDMLLKTALFLIIGVMIFITGTTDIRKMGGLMTHYPLLGWLFFIAALTLAGIPPFSGFIGKYAIIRGGFEEGYYALSIFALLISLLILLSIIRIFIYAFWGTEKSEHIIKKGMEKPLLPPIILLIAITTFLGLGAEFVYPYIDSTAKEVLNPSIYIQDVLGE